MLLIGIGYSEGRYNLWHRPSSDKAQILLTSLVSTWRGTTETKSYRSYARRLSCAIVSLSASGVFAIIMLVVGAALAPGVDARYLMAGALITMSLGNYWMAHLNLTSVRGKRSGRGSY
jgi:hypothetical protein